MGLIYLDTCLIIYLVERHPQWFGAIKRAMQAQVDTRFAVSPLVKAECLTGAFARGDLPLQAAYEALFKRLIVLDMPEIVFINAAHLRARFNLRMPDALHLACAQFHACDALWTNDARLRTAAGALAYEILLTTADMG